MNAVELVPAWRGEFGRWLRLCPAAGRFGWREVGFLAGYQERTDGVEGGGNG